MHKRLQKRALLLAAVAILFAYAHGASRCSAQGKQDALSKTQREGLTARVARNIIELQPFRQTSSAKIEAGPGKEGSAFLINLNPDISAWYVLHLAWRSGGSEESYHLANADPETQRLVLDASNPRGLVIVQGEKKTPCDLWGPNVQSGLYAARESRISYAPLCDGKIYLRNFTKGHQTAIERVTDILRDNVPAGGKIVSIVRDTVFKRLYTRKATAGIDLKPGPAGLPRKKADDAPAPAMIDPKHAGHTVSPPDLGIDIEGLGDDGMVLGDWYPVTENPGIYVSVIQPKEIESENFKSYRGLVNDLDSVEAQGLVYLIAFDLGRFELKYSRGTEHPRVEWSAHALPQVKDNTLPGPDGIGNIAPLISTGLINPTDAPRTAAAFTGGFKREHGALKYGALAYKNRGTHYGFMENGVIFSRLQPGLATLYVLEDGSVDMKTWSEEDDALVARIKYARQNGVPIIDGLNAIARLPIPGALVTHWGDGNWSGSEDKKLRSMRAGAALQETGGKRFLIYAFFWSATPSAMARVFQAYRCRYAMLLDMNALEHTYLAIYKRKDSNLHIQHLIQGMSVVDMSVRGQYVPRFLGYADDRDFFYLTRKETP